MGPDTPVPSSSPGSPDSSPPPLPFNEEIRRRARQIEQELEVAAAAERVINREMSRPRPSAQRDVPAVGRRPPGRPPGPRQATPDHDYVQPASQLADQPALVTGTRPKRRTKPVERWGNLKNISSSDERLNAALREQAAVGKSRNAGRSSPDRTIPRAPVSVPPDPFDDPTDSFGVYLNNLDKSGPEWLDWFENKRIEQLRANMREEAQYQPDKKVWWPKRKGCQGTTKFCQEVSCICSQK